MSDTHAPIGTEGVMQDMPKLVSTDDLKETLVGYTARGDERWALKGEIPTLEQIRQMVDESVEEIGGVDVSGLSAEDILEILQAAYDDSEGPPEG